MKGIIKNISDVITNSSSEVFVLNKEDARYFAIRSFDEDTCDCISVTKMDYGWIYELGRFETEIFQTLLGIADELLSRDTTPTEEEIDSVFVKQETWIQSQNPNDPIYIHTPTTMGNYHYKSMMKHPSCAKYVRIFGKPTALHAEYLMGLPIGASSPYPMNLENYRRWIENI